jgi:hypothetical protein
MHSIVVHTRVSSTAASEVRSADRRRGMLAAIALTKQVSGQSLMLAARVIDAMRRSEAERGVFVASSIVSHLDLDNCSDSMC